MTTVFRAFIMLAVFVGAPAAWVYYGPLPDEAPQIATRLVAEAKRVIGWVPGDNTLQASKSAPRFEHRPEFAKTSRVSTENLPTEMEPLLMKLRSLGVVEYVLENWGTGGLFRFHCAMPIAHSEDLTQQFEAIAIDDLAAVRQVVEEVTSWQVARR